MYALTSAKDEGPNAADQPTASAQLQPIHILLAGVDGHVSDDGRTDSIIVASLYPETNTVKLTSFMRDMYIEIPGHSSNRINAAYPFGGMELLMSTLEHNFGLNIDKYVLANFQGFIKVIDLMGGVDVNVKDYEIPEIYHVTAPGLQHLDGRQTLDYCLIRYAGNNDYERTERQRKVLTILVEKVKQMPASSYYKLYTTLRPFVTTNLTLIEMLKLCAVAHNMQDPNIETLRIPADDAHVPTYLDGMAVLVPDIPVNRACLEQFLFPLPNEGSPAPHDHNDTTDLPYPLENLPVRRETSFSITHYGIVSFHLLEGNN